MSEEQIDNEKNKPGLFAVIWSTLGAFIGVQNDQTRERDFQQKSMIPYLISGVVLATIFIVVLIMIAQKLDPGA